MVATLKARRANKIKAQRPIIRWASMKVSQTLNAEAGASVAQGPGRARIAMTNIAYTSRLSMVLPDNSAAGGAE